MSTDCSARYTTRCIRTATITCLARYCAGLDYELNKKNTVGMYYLIEDGLNFSVSREYVIGLGYEFVF